MSYLDENQKQFLAQWKFDIYRKEKKNPIVYPAKRIFWHQSGHKNQESENLNTSRLVFLSLLSVIFGFLTPKTYPYQISRWKDD